MDTHLQNALRHVYRHYPSLAGRRPKVQALRPVAGDPPPAGAPAYLLTFQSQGLAVDRRTITTLVRVVVDRDGKILKISTSR